ncbi:MAG: hypothetical protein KAG66_09865, partial [Methylococcales bacterium]|nr:hypothetical protein [Methylococcales bacterium]
SLVDVYFGGSGVSLTRILCPFESSQFRPARIYAYFSLGSYLTLIDGRQASGVSWANKLGGYVSRENRNHRENWACPDSFPARPLTG